MEKNKFTAKFRQKTGGGATSKQSMSGSEKFRSAGDSTASVFRSSRVGDSSFGSTASNFRSSIASSASSVSGVSSASGVESMAESMAERQKRKGHCAFWEPPSSKFW